MSIFIKQVDLTTETGFVLAFNTAKVKKPYTDQEEYCTSCFYFSSQQQEIAKKH